MLCPPSPIPSLAWAPLPISEAFVSVIHPDGHSILDRWRKQDGPCLWRFPLKATMPILPEFDKKCTGTIGTVSKKGATIKNVPVRSLPLKDTRPILPEFAKKCTGTIGTVSKMGATMENVPVRSTPPLPPTSPPQATKPSLLVTALSKKYEEPGSRGSSANFFVPPPTDPIQCPTALPLPPPARPITATPPEQPHPSQGCLAINQEGHACSVTYMYGAAQALALAA
jgi:hypothetical protein